MKGGPQLRPTRHADADAIRDLMRAAYAKWIVVTGREPLPMRVDYAYALKRHRFDLLVNTGDVAEAETVIGLIETVPEPEGYLLLVNMAVQPAVQRQGHGKRLLAVVDDLAASAELAGVRLYTNKLFTQNVQLYLSCGYRIERESSLNGGTAVHMVKSRF